MGEKGRSAAGSRRRCRGHHHTRAGPTVWSIAPAADRSCVELPYNILLDADPLVKSAHVQAHAAAVSAYNAISAYIVRARLRAAHTHCSLIGRGNCTLVSQYIYVHIHIYEYINPIT